MELHCPCKERKTCIEFNTVSGYTPLVEVNQAMFAWSFRQLIQAFYTHFDLESQKVGGNPSKNQFLAISLINGPNSQKKIGMDFP